ncbi:MAG: four helix bundle protein [Kiritimatiellae bacterium]|nr:four helix bundle protein [Kiritimatiellia bacterium]
MKTGRTDGGRAAKDDPLKVKSMDFAVRIVKLSRWLRNEKKEFSIADQIVRSGTSIGANLSEARYAASRKDFLNKCKISLKECSETMFWLELLFKSGIAEESQMISMLNDCREMRLLLSASCRTIEKGLVNQ